MPMKYQPSQEWFDDLPASRLAGSPLASTAAGALVGALGALLAQFAYVGRMDVDDPAVAILLGGAGLTLGGLFGRLTRRLFRAPFRVLWVVAMSVSLWLFLYAFVLTRLAPAAIRGVSFQRSLLCVALFGLLVGMVPPLRARSERGCRV
jgi:hypothetical protein